VGGVGEDGGVGGGCGCYGNGFQSKKNPVAAVEMSNSGRLFHRERRPQSRRRPH